MKIEGNNMAKCCIFDLDGTLLNTLTTITYYINRTLILHGLAVADEDEIKGYVGCGAANLVLKTLTARGITDEKYISEFLHIYEAAYDNAPDYLTEPYDGIRELISELRERGIKVSVLSNKPDYSTVTAVKNIFGDAFDIVHGGREGIALKPAPDGIFALLAELSSDMDNCVYIGDSEVDVKTAKAARMENFVAVTWGFRTKEQLSAEGAVNFADDVDELKSFILKRL